MDKVGDQYVYFPFHDGVIGYNCPECGFQCCRGAGFGASRAELVQLRRLYPTLEYFANPRASSESDFVQLADFKPACFFLQDSGACDVQVTHGRALKPHVCKTFPANAFSVHGDVVVAGLNFLCPLRVTKEGSSDYRLGHAEALADMTATIDAVLTGPDRSHGTPIERVFFEHEEWCRDLPEPDWLRRLAIFDLTGRDYERGAHVVMPSEGAIEAQARALASFRDRIAGFLGVEPWMSQARPLPDLSVLLPTIRFDVRRAFGLLPTAETLALLGRFCAALEVYLRVVAATGYGLVELGTVHQLFQAYQIPLYLLARIDEVPLLDAFEDDTWAVAYGSEFDGQLEALLTFIYEENDERRMSLAEVFGHLGVEDPLLRLGIMKSITPTIVEKLRFRPPAEG